MTNRWEKTRKLGKTRYMILSTLLFAITYTIVKIIIENNYDLSIFYSSSFWISIATGIICGLIASHSRWKFNEKRYKENKQ